MYVCFKCTDDPFLGAHVKQEGSRRKCTYCGKLDNATDPDDDWPIGLSDLALMPYPDDADGAYRRPNPRARRALN